MKYVILACSNDKIFPTPRQLQVVNGEKLVARTIRLLKENGVNDIVIATKSKGFEDLGVKLHSPKDNSYDYLTRKGYWLDAFPFELMDEPVCFIWGDVYFSENAMKTIVETETDSTMFFCAFENHTPKYIKKWDEPLAYKVVDTELFKEKILEAKRLYDEKVTWRNPIVWELYRIIHNQNINVHCMTTDYIAINDESVDIDSPEDIKMLEKVLGGNVMIKVEVTNEFTLERFNELKNIIRKNEENNEEGRLVPGDIFECNEEMAEYLTGKNDKDAVVVKVLEIIPEESKETVEEVKSAKKTIGKKTKKKEDK